MNIERGNVRNQFFVCSDLVSLYATTKVLSQIWGPLFCSGPPSAGGYGGPFLRLCMYSKKRTYGSPKCYSYATCANLRRKIYQ